GRAVLGNSPYDVTLGEHADGGVALGAHDILDDEGADIAGAHQLSGNGHCLVHSNGCNARGFFAQDVSDFHRKLLEVSRRVELLTQTDWYTLCQLSISSVGQFSIEN